jgi:hypothetical protein
MYLPGEVAVAVPARGSSVGGGAFDERKALDDLLQVHHLPGNELSNREPDDIGGLVDVDDDASYLGTCQAGGLGAEAQHDLVAVDGVDIEVDRGSSAAGTRQPREKRRARLTQLVGAERLKAPLGHVRIVVVGPRVQPNQGDTVRTDSRRKHRLHVKVTGPVSAETAIAW